MTRDALASSGDTPPVLETPWSRSLRLALSAIAVGLAACFVGSLHDSLRPLVPIGWAVWALGGFLAYRQVEEKEQSTLTIKRILLIAIFLRAVAFAMPPTLSDDVHRYLWDGWITLQGGNPFEHLPSDPALSSIQKTLDLTALNSPDYFSVYPATSQLLFALGALGEKLQTGLGIWTLKLVLGLIELGGLLLLARLARPGALVLYAWHPAVVVESWGQAHSEAAAAGLLILCCFALTRSRSWLAVAALSLAVWVKLHPLLLLPWLLAVVGWRWWWVAAATSVFVWLPFLAPFVPANLKSSMDLYTGAFEFNAGIYEFFVLVGDMLLRGSGLLGGSGDSSKIVALLLQCILLGILPVLYAKGCFQRWSFPRAAALTYGLVLMTTATIHPWYSLPLLALLAVAGRTAWHWQYLAVALSVSYLSYTHGQACYHAGMVLAWGGWFILLVSGNSFRKGKRKDVCIQHTS